MPRSPNPNAPSSPEPKRDIQIWPLIGVSARRCWSARDDLLLIGIVPLIVIFLAALPAQELMDQVRQAQAGGEQAILQAMADAFPHLALLALCSAGATCLFAVNLLRVLTLGPTSVPLLGLAISGRFLRFSLFMLSISVLSVVIMMVLALLLHGFGATGIYTAITLGTFIALGLIARLSPHWIGIAIDAPMGSATAWRRTAGQGTKLVLALFLIQISVLLGELVLGVILQATGLAELAPYAVGFLGCAIELIRLALQLGALLAAYPQFVRETV